MTDLGWANGWIYEPEIVLKCRAARKAGEKHERSETSGPWSCTHVVTCKTCGYTYKYDSGD